MTMKKECNIKPHLNFLYALVGDLEIKSLLTIANTERERLLFDIEGYNELDKILNE